MKTIAIFLLSITVLLWGCSKVMTNEEIINEVRFCKDNWMEYRTLVNWLSNEVVQIVCK